MVVMDRSHEYPHVKKYAGQDPAFAATMARIEVRLANLRAHLADTKRLLEEEERFERERYLAYIQRRRLFRF